EITLVVNPTSCQEVASAGPALKKAHWRVVASADPAGPKRGLRTLHAKFIFSANDRSAGNATSPWVYLGSGNLTAAGFLHRAGNAGNLEAGVVLALETLAWNSLCRRLPVEKDSADLTLKPGALLAGESAPPRLPEYFAPPVAFLELLEEPPRLKLPTGSGSLGNFEILSLNGQPIMVAVDGTYRWDAPPPSEVRVRWSPAGSPRTAVVPVLDRFGRLAGKPLPALDFIDLEEELRSFPNPPEDDDEEQDPGESDDGGEGAGSAGAGGAVPSNYPFREMMQAIETIAARQTMVPEAQWPAWCARLEQALVRMKASPPVASVHRLGVNPLSVLRRSEFRPDYAGSPGSCQLYEDALTRVEAAWDYSGLVPLGGTS
ncbi:MAG: hypothetical protein IPG47_17715, partial [Thermoflexaceae bacterium]|nr:hypothetical protein [Thermoflexaceae bacterium]